MAAHWMRAAGTALGLALIGAGASPAAAQLFWNPPDFRGMPVKGGEPGMGLPLPGASAAELSASLLWNMRAGLNVAALQCQFAPTLMSVRTYNEVIAHHGKELADAFNTMSKYFVRTKGAGRAGQTAFDQYTTRTYNGFSTLHAQRGFCQTAAAIGADALAQRKGKLLPVAQARMREFRNSLVPAGDRVFTQVGIGQYPLPRLDDACWTKGGLLKASCAGWRPTALAAPGPVPGDAIAG